MVERKWVEERSRLRAKKKRYRQRKISKGGYKQMGLGRSVTYRRKEERAYSIYMFVCVFACGSLCLYT